MSNSEKEVSAKLKVEIDGVEKIADASAEIAKEASQKTMGFLARLCSPAAEQLGLALADKIAAWRCANYLKFLQKCEALHSNLNIDLKHTINPRLMLELAESASLETEPDLQDWWAGLTVSSCDANESDENLIFVHLMSRITCLQAKIFNYACENSTVVYTERRLLMAEPLEVPFDALSEFTECSCVDRLDRELDALRNLGLLTETGGFNLHDDEDLVASIEPSPLGLQFYARCHGYRENLVDFLGAKPRDPKKKCPRCGGYHS